MGNGAPKSIDDQATKAKFFGLGFICGLVKAEEIREWVEAAFHDQESPPDWLMEVAFAAQGHWLDLFARLDNVALLAGVRKLQESDLRSLLDRLARAIDAGRYDPSQTIGSLVMLQAYAPRSSCLCREIRYEENRFSVRWLRGPSSEFTFAKLREWLERVRRDPESVG